MLFIWKYPNKSYNFDAKLKTRNYYEKDLFLHTFANKKQIFPQYLLYRIHFFIKSTSRPGKRESRMTLNNYI